MEQEKTISDRAKVESILVEIRKKLEFVGPENENKDSYTHFRGKIGTDVAFAGKVSYDSYDNYGQSQIYLQNKGCDLAEIRTEDGFLEKPAPSSIDNYGLYYSGHGVVFGGTKVEVISSKVSEQGDKAVITNLTENVSVAHDRDETATVAIDRIYDAINLSIAKEEIAQKLSKLNLPNLKLREATERLVGLLYGENEQSQIKDTGREQ